MGTIVTHVDFETTFTAQLWQWEARTDRWTFVSLTAEDSEDLRALPTEPHGFGSIPVRVRIGSSRWDTSVFPDASSGVFVLPVKAAVRRREGVESGDTVTVELRLR